MDDKSHIRTTDGDSRKSGLRLVNQVAEEKKAARLSDSAASELHDLIEEVQRKTPRKRKTADDDLLPPAA